MSNNKKIIEFIKKMWIQLWGKDLPKDITEVFPDNKFEWYDQVDLYNRLKKRIVIKRFFISLVIIVISYFLLNYLFNSISFLIKNNPTIACWNKPVCIYAGAKLNIDQSSSEFFINKYENTAFFITESKNYKLKQSKFITQVYDIDRNKIIKRIKKIYSTFLYNDIIPISKNEILFYSGAKKSNQIQHIYNIDKNIFKQEKINLPQNSYMLSAYNNGMLFMTNNSEAKNYFNRGLEANNILSKKENLLFLDFSTLKVEKFPDFSKQPRFLPQKEDVLILDNGKIIIPIKIEDKSFYYGDDRTAIWDHIEVYLPKENKFISLTDTKPIENNIFNINLENGDVLFINLDSTYLFKNDENRFVTVSKKENEQNKLAIHEISYIANYSFGEEIRNLILHRHKFIKLDNDKYLITCGYGVTFKKDYLCNKTVFFDYTSKIVTEGPSFLYPHMDSVIYKNRNNSLIVLGGVKYKSIPFSYKRILNDRVQVIEKR